MLRRLFALVILVGLVLAALYYWKYRPGSPAREAGGPGSVGDRLGQVGDTVSGKIQETRLAGSVKAALELNGALAAYRLDADAQGDTIVLRGELPSEDLRATASRVAQGVPGVAAVRDEIRVNPALPPPDGGRSVGETFDDRALEAKVHLAYSLNKGMQGSDVAVAALRRQVTLSGTVTSDAQRQLAVQLARETAGVAEVTDQIAGGTSAAPTGAASAPLLPPAGAAGERARAAQGALRAHPSLASYALSVQEQGGQLVLSGVVKTPAERDLAAYVASEAAGTKVHTNITVQQ